MRIALRIFWTCALLATPVVAAAAEPAATITLLEGQAGLVRGVTRYALAEGVRLQSGDIVEVSEKGLAEIEFVDGVAISLGAGTRMLATSMPRGKTATADCYVMRGTLKISGVNKAARLRITTPAFQLQLVDGTSVLIARDGDGSVFIETGSARLTVAPTTLTLKSGEFYARKAGQKGAVAPRPSQEFIGAMPKPFFDPLPSRMARYRDREVQPRRIEDVSYADVEAWLKSPPAIRRPLVARFEPRADDPRFRASLEANLRFHPEWDPILYPEKYPKEGEDKPVGGKPAAAK